MPLDLVMTLSDLVAIPSVNPMGRPVGGPEYLEHQVTSYLEGLFEQLELPWERRQVEPQRDNIIARLDGEVPPEDGGALIVLEAHQDTVPVDGMTIAPWTPTVRDGRLYGRGSCDIKGGMTAMLGALARLAEQRPPQRPTVIMACTVNEEHGYSGALALTQMWSPGGSRLIPRRPDACIVAEPTSLDVVVAHKGAVRWRLHTTGRAAHSSQPHLGENAVYRMARVLAALERYAREVLPAQEEHRLCGRGTLSVGMIRGGLSVNTVPDRCTIEIDRRILPGQEADAAYHGVIEYLAVQPELDFDVEHEAPYSSGSSLSDDANGSLAEQLSVVAREVAGRGERIGVPYGTDASKIAVSGVPSVVFGPGSIDQAHTADEWLALDQLELASETLYRYLAGGYRA